MSMTLGKAYVQIVPTTKDLQRNLTQEMTPAAKQGGERAGSNFASTFKKVIVAAGIGKVIKDAVSVGGELEQNLGGTEAVFGEFASTIQETATEAYRNMGLSASDYMATANKMGSLFQGSGVEQQRALQLTSDAMQRAADVASVMGIDTSMAMESIAGAAKGNFTMMDNLGVAMNATTLQAYALEKGINFKWNTADNAQKAEVAMQMFMERTTQYAGNFARESEETFSGSLGAMKASLTDLFAALATGADWDRPFYAFSKSIVTFAKNLVPMVVDIVRDLPLIIVNLFEEVGADLLRVGIDAVTELGRVWGKRMPEMISRLVNGLSTMLDVFLESLPDFIDAGIELIVGIAQGLIDAIPLIVDKIPLIVDSLLAALAAAIPLLIDAGVQLFTALVDALPVIIAQIVAVIPGIIKGIIDTLMDALPLIVEAGITLITALVKALPEIIKIIVDVLPDIIQSIIDALLGALPLIVQAGFTLFTALIDALPEIITTIVEALPDIIESIVSTLLDNLPLIINTGITLLVSLVKALPTIIGKIIEAIPPIMTSLVNEFTKPETLGLMISAGIELFMALIRELPTILLELAKAVPQILGKLLGGLADGIGDFVEVGKNMIKGIWEGIKGLAGWLWDKVSGWATDLWNGFTGLFGIFSPSKRFAWAGEMMSIGLAEGIEDNLRPVAKAMDALEAEATRSFESRFFMNRDVIGTMAAGDLSLSSGVSHDQVDYSRLNATLAGTVMTIMDKMRPVVELDKRELGRVVYVR
ncbi:MAG: phage tail protein [Clostridiaceae bacterium]|jgi:phage-related protein|nr:phage tail protein [Clostridiaceae bacterium]